MLRNILKTIFLCGALIAINAHAALNLELTQGTQGAIPVAIVPFSGQATDLQGTDNVAGVITNDLQNSGRFKLMSAQSMQDKPAAADKINFDYWKNQNINDMVVGSITPVSGGRYRVDFQLVNVFGAKAAANNSSAPAWQSAVLLTKTFYVNADQLRGVAHHISDLVYENLTGDKGVFSTKIAYVLVQRNGQSAQYALEVADMDGYNPRTLLRSSQPIMSPSWSRDGRKIAYVSFENERANIYIQDVATGSRQVLSQFQGINGAPAWSPDGSKLALVLTRDSETPKIYIMNVADKSLRQVTQGMSIDTEPSWSPDGRAIVFTSNRGGSPQIYRVDVASGNTQRVTFNGTYNARASYTADGNAIVVLHSQGGGYDIAIQNLTNSQIAVLTRSGDDQSPSVAPNGKMVVYATRSNGHSMLGMVSTDGKVKLVLPTREGDVREPAWSPFM